MSNVLLIFVLNLGTSSIQQEPRSEIQLDRQVQVKNLVNFSSNVKYIGFQLLSPFHKSKVNKCSSYIQATSAT